MPCSCTQNHFSSNSSYKSHNPKGFQQSAVNKAGDAGVRTCRPIRFRLAWLQQDSVFRSQRDKSNMSHPQAGLFSISSFFLNCEQLHSFLVCHGYQGLFQASPLLWHLNVRHPHPEILVAGGRETPSENTVGSLHKTDPTPLYPGLCHLSLSNKLPDLEGCLNTAVGRPVAQSTFVN